MKPFKGTFFCISIIKVFVVFFFFASFFLSFLPAHAAASWYSPNWLHRTQITFNHNQVGSSTGTQIQYFPVLISTTTTALKYTGAAGGGGHVASSTGGDIIFTDSNGTSLLNYEIESYASSTGTLVAWVKVPTLSTSTDTSIYMYYGNAAATAPAASVATGVWDDGGNNYFKAVYHLKETGTNPQVFDSTANANNSAIASTIWTPTTSGQMDGAANFNTSGQYIDVPNSSPLQITGNMTISFWANLTNDGLYNAIISKYASSGEYEVGADFRSVTAACSSSLCLSWRSTNAGSSNDANSWENYFSGYTAKWVFVTVVASGTNATAYRNGVSFGTVPIGSRSSSLNDLSIGDRSDSNNYYVKGTIDEPRISSTARSADWILTEYNNQNSPSTFETIAAEESAPATTFTFAGPSSGNAGATSTNFTVTPVGGNYAGTVTITPSGTGSSGLSATVLTWTNASSSQTFAITPTVAGSITLTPTNSGSITNPSSLTYAVNAVVPNAPTIGTATAGNTSAEVTFSAPSFNGGATITSYTVISNPGNIIASSSTSPITVTGLTNGTAYTFTVTATNIAGTGASSSVSNSVTPATVPDPPTGLVLTPSDSQVALSWTAPVNTGSLPLTNYIVNFKPTSTTTWSQFGLPVSTSTTAVVTGLINGQSYNFEVYSVSAVGSSITPSNVATATPATIPGAPTFISVVSGNALATVTFTPPNNGGSAISNYTVTSNPGNVTSSSSTPPITVTGLTNGTPYTFTVFATNAIGTGPVSSASSPAVTPSTTPAVPTAVSAVAGPAQVTLTWSAPADNGGSLITDYFVQYKLDASSTWSTFDHAPSTATTTIITGLTNGSLYDFQVSAVNSVGNGSPSSPFITSTPYTIPGKPTNVVATSDNDSSSISFNAPLDTGGSIITSYTVTSNPGNQIGTGSASPITVSNLTNGILYTFTVTATNAAGTGSASDPSSPVMPATIPDAPSGLVASAGQGQVELTWIAPVNDGGSTVTDYVIEYESSGSGVWSTFSDGVSPDTSATVTGLQNGQAYDFRVSAVNDVGQGSPSVQTSAMPVTVPDAPTIGTVTPGNASVSVVFIPPGFDGGSTINSYTVTSDPGGFTGIGSASPITVTGLTNGTSYTFTVTANNSVGVGASSSPSAAVIPVTIPDAPTMVVATPGNGQASVSFGASTDDGGTTITSYTVTSNPDGITSTSNASPIIVTGLTKGDTYQFTVTATNAVGTSSPSSPSNQVELSTEPDPPTNLAATVEGGSILLNWSAPTSNGGSDITDYIVEYELSTGGTWSVFADGTSTNATALVTGLADKTSYDFRVSAVNIIGESTPSNVATATPGEPAQVLIQSFSKLTVPAIYTNIRITNEGTSQYEYQYTWCINGSLSEPCGSSDDIFDSTDAKLIQPGTNYDMVATSTVPVPGNYYFHVDVLYGSQSSSADQSFTAIATYPDAPTNVVATSATSAQATVTFTAPSANGSVITGYTVTSSPGGIVGTGSSSPIIVSGLTNGTTYTFIVTATNGVGTSQASSPPSNSVTPVTIPDAPTGVTAVPGNGQVTLSWTAPDFDGGTPITDYVIEYKLSSDSTWQVFADGISTLTTATVTGITNDVSYDFQVSAVNAVGQSLVNSTSATLPMPYSQPATPPGGGSSGGSYSSSGSYVSTPVQVQSAVPPLTISTSTSTEGKPSPIPMASVESRPTQIQNSVIPTKLAVSPITQGRSGQTLPIQNIVRSTPTEHPVVLSPTKIHTSWSEIVWTMITVIAIMVFVGLIGFTAYVLFLRHKNRKVEAETQARRPSKLPPHPPTDGLLPRTRL